MAEANNKKVGEMLESEESIVNSIAQPNSHTPQLKLKKRKYKRGECSIDPDGDYYIEEW